MKRLGRFLKYIILIPVRILYLPRIYRRLVSLEEKEQDFRCRMQMVEDDIRSTHPDLRRRMQTVEDNIRSLNPEEHTRLFNEARHEYYIAETMLKALAANLRDSVQAVAEIKAKQEVLESMKDFSQKNLDMVRMHEAGLAAAVRDLTQDMTRLKEILASGEGKNDRKGK